MRKRLNPEELGRDLRQSHGPFMKRRRGIVGLAFFSCAVLGTIALYQIGVLKRLPEPRGKIFDTGKVNGSREAYSMLAVPDAFLGLASYAATAALASMGPENRSRTYPWMAFGMGLKVLGDSAMATKLTMDEFTRFRAFSIWSILTAIATWTAVPLALPETKAALEQLRGRHLV
jgi:hypothetical protein